MLGLTVHAFSEGTISSALAVPAKLVHVVSIVWAAVVRMVVWVTPRMSLLATVLLLNMLALCSRGAGLLLTWLGWIGRIVAAVLRVVIPALAVLLLALGERSVIRAGSECAARTLLGRTSLLLTGRALLSVSSIVLLVTLLRCEVLRAVAICSGECARLRLSLAVLSRVVILAGLARQLLSEGIIRLLWRGGCF